MRDESAIAISVHEITQEEAEEVSFRICLTWSPRWRAKMAGQKELGDPDWFLLESDRAIGQFYRAVKDELSRRTIKQFRDILLGNRAVNAPSETPMRRVAWLMFRTYFVLKGNKAADELDEARTDEKLLRSIGQHYELLGLPIEHVFAATKMLVEEVDQLLGRS